MDSRSKVIDVTIEQKLKKAALSAILHQAIRSPVKNPARTARNLIDFIDVMAGGLEAKEKERLLSQVESQLSRGIPDGEIQRYLESAAGL